MNKQPTILLIDIECSCNDEPAISREEMEIIEIGAIVGTLSATSFKTLDERQFYVRPEIHTELTPFCIELTGIDQDKVAKAPLLAETLTLLSDWLSRYGLSAWGSWGKFDSKQFQLETDAKALTNPLEHLQHINIKQLFARKRGHRVGLARAVQLSGLSFKGRHHSGLDDTRNIAEILGHDTILRDAILSRL